MPPALETLGAYLSRIAPGLALAALLLWVARRDGPVRIVIYLALFVLGRDAMTPLGLWSFGSEGGFWIRLSADPLLLVLFGGGCLAVSLSLYFLDRENRPLVRWTRGGLAIGLLAGLAGAVVVVAPLAVRYQAVPLASRGGPVPGEVVPALVAFALLGNLLEELLFRGYVYGRLAQRTTPLRAGVLSGVVFAFCHVFLALTVTDVGTPLLLFTLWEGILAGLVGAWWGVLPATLTHGGAIFLLASGWL